MANTIRNTAALNALAADNSTGAINAQVLRDIIVSCWNRLDDPGITPGVTPAGPGNVSGSLLQFNASKVSQIDPEQVTAILKQRVKKPVVAACQYTVDIENPATLYIDSTTIFFEGSTYLASGGTFEVPVGERILLMDLNGASPPGIFIYNGAGVALTPAPDLGGFNGSFFFGEDYTAGAIVYVRYYSFGIPSSPLAGKFFTSITDNNLDGNIIVAWKELGTDVVLFPLKAATVYAPDYVLGGMYFDVTLNKLRIGGASGWETVTSV